MSNPTTYFLALAVPLGTWRTGRLKSSEEREIEEESGLRRRRDSTRAQSIVRLIVRSIVHLIVHLIVHSLVGRSNRGLQPALAVGSTRCGSS
jgi:hypothetical protein